MLTQSDRALVTLGRLLRARHYRFTTITPNSHGLVLQRPSPASPTLRDIFGWNRSFPASSLEPDIFSALRDADALSADGDEWRSKVRFSTLDDNLYVHSGYPTHEQDAVFFGPDTYRFARAIKAKMRPFKHCVEVGAGSGAGALTFLPYFTKLTLGDINPRALRYATINAAINALDRDRIEVVQSDLYAQVQGDIDLIIANPPYLADPTERTYRHGGSYLGTDLSVRIVKEGIERLQKGGLLLLYTGAPWVGGVDILQQQLNPILATSGCRYQYEELDPDVFGEELVSPAYHQVERLAVVLVTLER